MTKPYEIEAGTVAWARKRVQQLEYAEPEIGEALSYMNMAIDDLRAGADKMDDQPQSDAIRSYANDIEKQVKSLEAMFKKDIVNDRKAIVAGIRIYEEGNGNDCGCS